MSRITPQDGDALVVVDLQNDFVTGSLPVPDAPAVVEPLNRAIATFTARGLPVFATRDWHPPDHCSFRDRGGPWPEHCVAGTPGADFVQDLRLPADVIHIHKATERDTEAYSALAGTPLAEELRTRGVRRVFVGGLATDYCVVNTVRDAIPLGLDVVVLADACRAVNAHPDDGVKAEAEMQRLGARFTSVDEVSGATPGRTDSARNQ
ncbi:MAG: isochorismatase family protein [Acidobacteria bacterium]|nr:isochorismatase family protein [Acidobacteriota bacterium]